MSPLETEIRRLIEDAEALEGGETGSVGSEVTSLSAVIARDEPEASMLPEFEMYDFDELAKHRGALARS